MNSELYEDLVEYFYYLDDLRESGEANMFGASSYLETEYGLSKKASKEVLLSWMETFDENLFVEERISNVNFEKFQSDLV